MKRLRISMVGAGSGFVLGIAKSLVSHEFFEGCEFVLMDINRERLQASERAVSKINAENKINISSTTELNKALEKCDYVISSCEMNRYANWVKDLNIPARHGVYQIKGENGGPGGLIHGLRNIHMFQEILAAMEKLCPNAWLLNFTNPMSILCTYFKNYSPVKFLGFCHQMHGSFGVIAEMLGMEPGELEVLSGGINHLNWLFDIRKKGSGKSCTEEFLSKVRKSKYWKKKFEMVPPQTFTLEVLNTFNMYPIGYDDHIIEYLPFFWEQEEWKKYDYTSLAGRYEKLAAKKSHTLEQQGLLGKEYKKPPFPINPHASYYKENPCTAIIALETNSTKYFDAMVIENNGAISNLPAGAIVDVPAVIVAGKARSVHVGELPIGPMEICRRQITLHEMIAKAAHEGDGNLILQALCLDPYIRSLAQARKIWSDFKREYKECLVAF